ILINNASGRFVALAIVAANPSGFGCLSRSSARLEIWVRHQPQHWAEIRYSVSNSHAPCGAEAARNLVGDGRDRQTPSASVPAYCQRYAVRTGAPSFTFNR